MVQWRKYYAVVLGKRIYFFKNDKTDVTENMVGHLEISGPDVVKPEETKKKYAIFSVTAQTGIYQIKVRYVRGHQLLFSSINKGGRVGVGVGVCVGGMGKEEKGEKGRRGRTGRSAAVRPLTPPWVPPRCAWQAPRKGDPRAERRSEFRRNWEGCVMHVRG